MNPSNQNAFNNTLVGYMRALSAIYNDKLRPVKKDKKKKVTKQGTRNIK